ncbi:MAG: LacI family DNA-binding transcriptional regulator [Alphaproteobacteria bacterium]|nr:LacI family DNA-binding transcriptional regulator [Alphaproteobacteria bacterium]
MPRHRSRTAPSIVEVAAASGVSMKTVSRVLNEEGSVREDTARKVREAAAALGYTLNLSAQRLARGRSHNIGILLVARSNWQRTAELVSGALGKSQAIGYGLVPHVLAKYEGAERDGVLALKARKAVDGLILTVPWSENLKLLADLAERAVPHVRISGPLIPGHVTAHSNDEMGAYALTRHLLDLGHRRIGVIGGQRHLNVTRERLAGYEHALREAAIDPRSLPHFFDDYLFGTGFRGAKELLALSAPPSALLCLTDILAAGAIRRCHEMNVTVPGKVSIAGMGDSSIAEMIWPTLTTATVPTAELAARAVGMLVDVIEGKTAPTDLILDVPLVVRGSTARV